jgi:hypothetical protein
MRREVNQRERPLSSATNRSRFTLAVSWTFVILPLLWGLYETIRIAAPLLKVLFTVS